ncbi:hypothetical protein Patl1_21867 [Pistacia atlantica]|uniref:Uncharacterized protein n=1 Tax=Pistacia atlantica TaxID=434234 RepID=A0ACC1BKW1_9ROSI|nr:hypothetical protein Patl1_21867 [Pistacia atlantica]
MILSALLTSVGINLGLCFLFFTLYSILRNQPSNLAVYAPRLLARPPKDELLSTLGFDAVVFMRIFIFCLKVFTFAGIIGVFILLPVNYLGNQLSYDFSDLPNKSLDSFSISNVDNGSNRLWIHFCAVYVFTAAVCYLLYYSDAEKLYRRLAFLKLEKDSQQRFRRDGFLGLFGRKVDLLDHYEKKLEDLQDNVRMERSSLAGKLSFGMRMGDNKGSAMLPVAPEGVNPTDWITEQAPDPQDVYWPFFSASFMKRWICKLLVYVASFALILLFLVPVVIVQGLTHLDQLETWFPFLRGILSLTFISQVITGYLPSLILQLFLSFVPPVMILFSSIEGYISLSQVAKSACNKMWWFTVWNIFFVNVLSGTALYQVNLFLEPKKIPQVLAEGVPAQVPSIAWHSEIPRIVFFELLGITYFFLDPLILPFLLVFYCLGYIIYRNQLLNVYAPKFETGGKFWPIVHNSTIFSLILMHIIAIGIFGLKKLPLASSLTIPLPVLTLLFNEYCRKRFLPMFKAFPMECLVKKDREDQNDPYNV